MTSTVNRYSNVIELRERNLEISEIAARMECSERTVRRLLEQGARSEQRIVDFENEWRAGTVPRIEDAVPSQGNLTRREILEELVCVDLEYRWRNPDKSKESEASTGLSSRPLIEDYVKRFPELSVQGQIPPSLVSEEFRVRMKWGDQPDYTEYQERFPNRKNSLAQQLERIHDEMAAEHSLDAVSAPSPSPLPVTEPKTPPPTLAPTSAPPDAPPDAAQDSRMNPTLDIRAVETKRTPVCKSEKYTTRAEPRKGGMAIVWRAFDSRLNREVAYKELRPDRASEKEFLEMFLDEAQITGQLEHPNIVPVYELGDDTSDNRPFYTMKYMRGGTLTDAITKYRDRHDAGQTNLLDLHRLLSVFLDVCHAIRYAHSRGVLHRDLKPDNVMVGDYGEVLVVDWGLAKVLGVSDADLPAVQLSRTDHSFTEVGARKGTPAYWAPEQAEGRGDLVDPRTDIYGLGGILFQILTGEAPHPELDDDSGPVNRSVDVRDPRDLQPSIPAPLAAICLKAMSPQRSDRYSKVDELIADIDSWRVDEPVSAYQETLPERTLRQVRRNWIASVTTVVGLLAVVLVLTALHFTRKNNRQMSMNREIDALSEFASSQEAKLMARINVLNQDVAFLSTLDQVHTILRGEATADSDSTQLEEIFTRFLQQRPEYMQLRLISKDGQELVRVQRNTPEGNVITIPKLELQKKGDRDYFTETMRIKQGGWYLSKIELNQENNKKDKNLPVIRGAVPVYVKDKVSSAAGNVLDASRNANQPVGGDSNAAASASSLANQAAGESPGESLEGIVIINLHFRKLVTEMRDFEESSASGLIYLTDSKGHFLYHPQKDIAFSFERNLDYRLQQLYTPLNRAYVDGLKQLVVLDATPQMALFVKPDPDYVRDDPAMWRMLNEQMATALISVSTDHPGVKFTQGEEGDAIVFGVSKTELEQIGRELKATQPVKIDARIIGSKLSDVRQAVHYNRLSIEPGNDERALGLALVVPHKYLEAESSYSQWITWVTLTLLALGVTSLVYFVARKTPHTSPKTALA